MLTFSRIIKTRLILIKPISLQLKRFITDELKCDLRKALDVARRKRFQAQRVNCLLARDSSANYYADSNGNFIDVRNDNALSNNGSPLYDYGIKFGQLFRHGCDKVTEYLENNIPVDDDSAIAFASLFRYMKQLDVHVNGLEKITGFTPRHESDTAMILAAHLLSKFAVDDSTSYIISNDSKFKSRHCPCGCKQELLYGNTYIGSEYLFHGKPDIVIFPNGAGSCGVLIPKAHGNELENWDEEDEVQMVEVKKNKMLLRNRHTENQVASLAKTFSYFQRIRQHRKDIFLSNSEIVTVIPTISICGDCFDIYLYDTENDIFLRNYGDPIPLWQDSKTLSLSSILIIWMVINHMYFRPKILDSMKVITGSCGLNQQLSDRRIEKIEETMRTQHSKFMPLQVQEDNIEGSVPIDFEAD